IRLSALTRFHHLSAVTAVYRVRNDASNVTAVMPWRSADAQAARRRLFEKHAARRSASTEMALVDSLETDLYALRDAAAASRTEAEALRLDLAQAGARIEADQAALASAAAREAKLRSSEAELRSSSAASARQSEESASREQDLAVQNAHLRSEVAKLNATLEQIYRSRVWRLFTPWWKLKGFLTR